MIEVSRLTRRFPGSERPALENVSFRINEGECVVVSGANGSGKSVLMSLIAGLDRPSSGQVFLGDGIGSSPRVGLVFQDADSQILGDTPLEDAAYGPGNLGLSRNEARRTAREALERVGLRDKELHPARALSGGEKRRLAVAGILAMDARIIVFDEPYANLDWPGVLQVNDIVRDLKKRGKTLLILTHELEKVLALSDRLMVLFRGSLVFDGTPAQALSEAPLEGWGIRNPLGSYKTVEDLHWTSPEGAAP